MTYGPQLAVSEEIGAEKHRQAGETFEDAMRRQAAALADGPEHEEALLDIYLNRRFLNAGRVQTAAGSFRSVTAFNCFVSVDIEDSMLGIMDANTQAALTMQKGGGIGYNFSTIRPKGAKIKSLDSYASGPLSFMRVFDATCATVASAGNRRGAQMGVLNVSHPDIREFVRAKTNNTEFKHFNLSVGITDAFMKAVEAGAQFPLEFEGEVYDWVDARELWDLIMECTWDWAEPGVLFVDRMNEMNNLWWMETISATNPCGEQPLPPYGACLLGSINWAAYVNKISGIGYSFDLQQLKADIPHIVRALDNVIDRTIFPLPEQEREAKLKRRMGIGSTGVANAIEALGFEYASPKFLGAAERIQKLITHEAYRASIELAKEKGSFPALSRQKYLASRFIQTLPSDIHEGILAHGIRNSHLTSIAPTGSVSLAADNISSGIEPVFSEGYDRTILMADGSTRVERVDDYGVRVFGVKPKTADQLTPTEHVSVLTLFQKYVDSACSKTCNIGSDVTFDEFKDVYMQAYKGGAKGCTTYRADGKRFGILNVSNDDAQMEFNLQEELEEIPEGTACYIDPLTGKKSCE